MTAGTPALDGASRIDLLGRLARFTSDDDDAPADELAQRFLYRREYEAALEPRIVILRGDRGAGKTALFRVITSQYAGTLTQSDTWWQGFSEDPGHPSGDAIVSLAVRVDDRLLRTFWLTHLAGRLREHDSSLPVWVPSTYVESPGNPAAWLEDADEELGRIQTGLDACESALVGRGESATLAYDHLDRIGVTDPHARVRAASALMAVWLSLSGRYRAIRGKLFLRNDLYAAGLSQSADASKLEARSVNLDWSTQDLYRALVKRLGADDHLREWVVQSLGKSILTREGAIGWVPAPLPPEGSVSQKAFADALVGEIMGRGVKKGYTYRWIPNHLQDGNGRIVPRSLFNLIRFAADHALEASPRATGRHLLHHTELQAALGRASGRRVNELEEEYAVVRRVKALSGRMAPFDRLEVVEELQAPDTSLQDASSLVDELVGIGLFTLRKDGRLDVPDIYRFGLEIKRKGGTARPQ